MNWGVKILIAYLLFLVSVLASVFFAMNQKIELVTDNYYEKELKYQEQIDKLQRTKLLNEKTEIRLLDKHIRIKFPAIPDKNNEKSFIFLYRPSDISKDLKLRVSADSLGVQLVPADKLVKGFWKIKLEWVANGMEYYDEGILNIP